MNFLALVLASMLEGETRNAGGSLFGDDLDALDHSGDNFVFNAGVKALSIFADHDQVHAWIPRRNMREVANRAEVCEQFEALAEFDVDAGKAAANWSGHRTFQSDAGALDGFAEFSGNVFVVFLEGFGAGGEAFPFELDAGSFDHANCSLNNFRADSVAGNERYLV